MDKGWMYEVWLLVIAETEVPGKELTKDLEFRGAFGDTRRSEYPGRSDVEPGQW